MRKSGAAKKALIIFDLNGTLCHYNKNLKNFARQGIYSEGDMKAEASY
jgi:hydroxymethylpyrimidine pyrophosphatase-like HAD family hydrolase